MSFCLRGIRGATTAEANEEQAILEATGELLQEMVRRNQVELPDVAGVFFTVSPDLNATFPARAARDLGWAAVPLLDSQEVAVPWGMKRCIRILVLVNTSRTQQEVQHVYLREAAALRPDLGSAAGTSA